MDEATPSQAADIADGWEQSRLDGPILNAVEGPIARGDSGAYFQIITDSRSYLLNIEGKSGLFHLKARTIPYCISLQAVLYKSV